MSDTAPTPTLDPAQLRAIADAGIKRLSAVTDEESATMRDCVRPKEAWSGSAMAEQAIKLAVAEARERGYREAVFELLGAPSAPEVGT